MMRSTRRVIVSAAILVIVVLAWALFRADSPPRPEIDAFSGSSAVPSVTLDDGRRETYQLWKLAEQLSPLDLSAPDTPRSAHPLLLQQLKDRSFVIYQPRHRQGFRAFRDMIVDCTEKQERGTCVPELMGEFNTLLADWELDPAAATAMNDPAFSDYIGRHETFMKRFALLSVDAENSGRPDPSGCALVYGELSYLAERLMGLGSPVSGATDIQAQARRYMTGATRAGVLAVDTSLCPNLSERRAMDDFRATLVEVSGHLGEGEWNSQVSRIMAALIVAWAHSTITEGDYFGTRFGSMAGTITQMRQLAGDR
jgi:hypothetical protein